MKVSHFLGSAYRPIFLSRFCTPVFGSGFDSVPDPVQVPGERMLNVATAVAPPRSEDSIVIRNHGYYKLRYNLDPRVAVCPEAFVRKVPDEGPYKIENMWTTDKFHSTML